MRNEEWDTILEQEGSFNIIKITNSTSQIKNLFTASFVPVIQTTTMKKLWSSELSLIDT